MFDMTASVRIAWSVSILLFVASIFAASEQAYASDDDRSNAGDKSSISRENIDQIRRFRNLEDDDLPEFRSIDGTGNNLTNREYGAALTPLTRMATSAYADDIGNPGGTDRNSPRMISNMVASQQGSIPNENGGTDFVWIWGQFLDHDLDLVPTLEPVEAFDIPIPVGDAWFDPAGSGDQKINLNRSAYVAVNGRREQINIITAWIDGSNVYGSELHLANALRTNDGSGELRTDEGDLLPPNPENPGFFLAGDERVNEHAGLTAMHTLFVREHNHWARYFRERNPQLNGDRIYDLARIMVVAEIQAVTYREFLPVLLGSDAIAPYRGYRPDVDPAVSNEFATASYRFGHSMVSSQLLRIDEDGDPVAGGPLSLREAFFRPDVFRATGLEPLFRGFATQVAQKVDPFIVDDLRNFLFGRPGSGGFDLAALNIQRGRDHGLPSYNDLRRKMGLTAAADFADVTPIPDLQEKLARAYATVEDIDLWVGGLSEERVADGMVGETIRTVLVDQFTRVRDGDRFWYERYLPDRMVERVERQTLARIIRRNTGVGREIQSSVFRARSRTEQD